MEKAVWTKQINKLTLIVGFLLLCSCVTAQEIEVRDFKRVKKKILQSDQIFNGDLASECAVVYYYTNDQFVIEPNLGIRKQDTDNSGIIILYVPDGTTNMSVFYKDDAALYYVFPEPLRANHMYSMKIQVSDKNNISTAHSHPTIKSLDIELSDFRLNPQNLTASIEPEYDRQGAACAVIRYTVNDENFEIDPNLGSIKTIRKPGEIIQYVPQGTKRLTVRNGSYMPLRDYYIPIEIESKATYDVVLSLTDKAIKRQKASPDHDNYLGIGYNDPSLSFSSEGGTRRFTIHCNTSWDISAPSWCKLSKNSGTGVMEIEVTAKNNSTVRSRHGVIGIQSQDITVTIVVEQEGK